MPLLAYFYRELIRWRSLWMRQKSDSRSRTILKQHADYTFFPNMWERFKKFCVITVGSVEAEGSFYGKKIHNWFRSSCYPEGSIKGFNCYSYANSRDSYFINGHPSRHRT